MARRVSGVGLGLRWEFLEELEQLRPELGFLEISPENYMRRGGFFPAALRRLAAHYPVVTHGLTMSLGGVDPLDAKYLGELSAFLGDVETPWHSDHLCFAHVGGRYLHDLLPVRFTADAAARVAERIMRARDALGLELAFENISYYLDPGRSTMGEAEFIAEVCRRAQCGFLLDINNAYVNAQNHGVDLSRWLATVPLDRVVEIHVAGHTWHEHAGERLIVDTHGESVCDPVLDALGQVIERTGAVPVLLERDQNIPSLTALVDEVRRIEAVVDAALARRKRTTSDAVWHIGA